MMSAGPARYRQFPSLSNPVLSQAPENQQILRNLKKMYDEHSKDWDMGTRYAIIDFVLNGHTEVTERIARTPSNHRLMQRHMTFAIWIVLRATYGLERLSRVKHWFTEKFPGVDPASFVSPVLGKSKTKSGHVQGAEDGLIDATPAPPPSPRAPSIFGQVDVSKFTYDHHQSDSQKRKRLDIANYQPWKIPKKTIKREPDTTTFSTGLRPPAFPHVYLLPTEDSRNTASPVDNALLPSIETPYGPSDSEQDIYLTQKDKENHAPSFHTPLNSPAQVSHSANSMESENVGTSSPLPSSQITPLVEQCQKFDTRIHELQATVNTMRKERQAERQSFIKTITSIRDEIRTDMNHSRESIISTKTAKVDTALIEYSNTVRTLRASLDALAAELGGRSGQDKASLDLKKTVDDLRNSMGIVATYSEAQQQEFRDKVKAFDQTTHRSQGVGTST